MRDLPEGFRLRLLLLRDLAEGNVTLTGELGCWESRAGGDRFCQNCGSSLFCWADGSDEIEIKLGTLDEPPKGLVPAYELWTIRREHWLAPLGEAEQHERDRSD